MLNAILPELAAKLGIDCPPATGPADDGTTIEERAERHCPYPDATPILLLVPEVIQTEKQEVYSLAGRPIVAISENDAKPVVLRTYAQSLTLSEGIVIAVAVMSLLQSMGVFDPLKAGQDVETANTMIRLCGELNPPAASPSPWA